MSALTVTARGQVTFRKEILHHLGIQPGDRIEIELLPQGKASLSAIKPSGSIESFFGCLAGDTDVVATIEEINEAAAHGWAGLID